MLDARHNSINRHRVTDVDAGDETWGIAIKHREIAQAEGFRALSLGGSEQMVHIKSQVSSRKK